MKKFAALVLAMIMSISMIAFAEQEIAIEEAVVEEVAVEETAAEETAEEVHVHVWNFALRTCADCGEAHPCFVEGAYAHDFTDSETCLNCGAAKTCGVEGHEGHEIASCGVAGHFTCDGLDHDAVYGKGFDMEGHTKCLEEVEHTCESCGVTYLCERSNSHVTCKKCGEPWCYKAEGNHTEAECGHRYCEIYGNTTKHSRCEGCRKFLCNGKDHSKCGGVKVEEDADVETAPSYNPEPAPSDDPN